MLTSGLPFSDTGAGLLLQVALLVALSNGAWRLQRQLVLADSDRRRLQPSLGPGRRSGRLGAVLRVPRSIIGAGLDRPPLVGDELDVLAAAAPDSDAAQLFNRASPWFYAYGAALGSVAYAAVLLVPPYRRRGRLVALGCVLGVLAVGPGLTTIGETARVASAAVAQEVRRTVPTAESSVGSAPPGPRPTGPAWCRCSRATAVVSSSPTRAR